MQGGRKKKGGREKVTEEGGRDPWDLVCNRGQDNAKTDGIELSCFESCLGRGETGDTGV